MVYFSDLSSGDVHVMNVDGLVEKALEEEKIHQDKAYADTENNKTPSE